MEHLKNGDILLCSAGKNESWPMSWFASLIKLFTHSPFSHVAMVVESPCFTNIPLEGLFVWESSGGDSRIKDPQDGKHKFGVRLTPLNEFFEEYRAQEGTVWVRVLEKGRERLNLAVLQEIHDSVYGKPYDLRPDDWLKALFPHTLSTFSTHASNERFWCSALVGYIYVKAGLLEAETIWSFLSPADFSSSTQKLSLTRGTLLSKEKQIL